LTLAWKLLSSDAIASHGESRRDKIAGSKRLPVSCSASIVGDRTSEPYLEISRTARKAAMRHPISVRVKGKNMMRKHPASIQIETHRVHMKS
jgi:hypothetical protein